MGTTAGGNAKLKEKRSVYTILSAGFADRT